MEQLIHFFQKEMKRPALFSWFHILFLVLIIASTALASYFFRNSSEKIYKRILLIGWIIILVLEIMKQIIKSFHYGTTSYWDYDFYDFPFHLCSMSLYLLPILIFVKREKCPHLVDAINGFMSFFVLLSGSIVVIYNDIVMSRLIFTNIQTMVHHGILVTLGVFVFVWNRKNVTIKTYLKSLIVFGAGATIALLINVIVSSTTNKGIDMFYLNPLKVTSIPVAGTIQAKAGFLVYLLCYLVAFCGVSFLIYLTETKVYKFTTKGNG